MGTTASHHEPLDRSGIRLSRRYNKTLTRSFRDKSSKKSSTSPRRMDKLRRSFRDSFRKRKEHVPESSKPHQWQSDELGVRAGTCNFQVKYLGCVEVFESRGMQVCEEALKVLRGNTRRRPVKAILYVSGDGLRVVEDETKGLIVDQTIEKVSFCAPDRNHEKGFSYICRDGTTRRWMCHGFLALKESGERLSHAVGCAFAACLERKQKRDKECGVTMTFDAKNSTFTRSGSFRHAPMTERYADPQEIKPGADPPPVKPVYNPYAIERPHATPSMLQRQGSFRGFSQLPGASPFKRQLSLRISELPSNLERQRSLSLETDDFRLPPSAVKSQVSPIPELSSLSDRGSTDPVSAMCQQLSQGLSLLSKDDFLENKTSVQTTARSDGFRSKIDSFSFRNHDGGEKSWKDEPGDAAVGLKNVNILPKPDQWLGTIVANSSNAPATTAISKKAPPLAHLRAHSLGSENFFAPRTQPRFSQLNGIVDRNPNPNRSNVFVSDVANLDPRNGLSSYASEGAEVTAPAVNQENKTSKDPFDAEWAAVLTEAEASESSGGGGDGDDDDEKSSSATNPFVVSNPVKSFEVRL